MHVFTVGPSGITVKKMSSTQKLRNVSKQGFLNWLQRTSPVEMPRETKSIFTVGPSEITAINRETGKSAGGLTWSGSK